MITMVLLFGFYLLMSMSWLLILFGWANHATFSFRQKIIHTSMAHHRDAMDYLDGVSYQRTMFNMCLGIDVTVGNKFLTSLKETGEL